MLKWKKGCNACKVIRKEGGVETSDLFKRLNASTQFVRGGEHLSTIHIDYATEVPNVRTLSNHCKKHQAPDGHDLLVSRERVVTRRVEERQIKKRLEHEDVRTEFINKALEAMHSGDMKMTASALVSALKHVSDIEEKHLDRQVAMMEMVNKYRSGEFVVEGEIIERNPIAARTGQSSLEG